MSFQELFMEEAEMDTRGMSQDEVIREYLRLDQIVKEAATQRSWAASILAQTAARDRGALKTVHIESSDRQTRVKVEFGTQWKVTDASEMEVVKDLLGPTRFNELFKVEYVPRARAMQSFLATSSGDEKFRTAKEIVKQIVVEQDKMPSVSAVR